MVTVSAATVAAADRIVAVGVSAASTVVYHTFVDICTNVLVSSFSSLLGPAAADAWVR